jgi:hypothetical protein
MEPRHIMPGRVLAALKFRKFRDNMRLYLSDAMGVHLDYSTNLNRLYSRAVDSEAFSS